MDFSVELIHNYLHVLIGLSDIFAINLYIIENLIFTKLMSLNINGITVHGLE